MKDKTKKISTWQLSWKAFKEVVAIRPWMGIGYFIDRNLSALISIYEIYISGRLLDSVAKFIINTKVFSWQEFFQTNVFTNFIILLVTFFFSTLISKLDTYFDTILYDQLWYAFQQKTLGKISSLNQEDIEQNRVQDLLNNVPNYSVEAIWDTYRKVSDLGSNIITLVSSAFVIATQMAWWGVGVILLVIPEAYFRFKYSVKLKKYRDENTGKRKYSEYLASQARFLPNFSELRVNNIFSFFSKSYANEIRDYYTGEYKVIGTREQHAFLWSWLDGTLYKIVQILLIPFVILKRYSIGTFKYLIDYIDNLYYSSWYVLWQILTLRNNSLYIQDYFELFDYKGFGDVTSGDKTLDPLKVPTISFENVSFKYPNTEGQALSDVSFKIEPGQKIVFIGKDNSGKSTIAKLLCGLYRVGPGDILFDGISIKDLARGELKNKIAVVFESYVKYNFSIRRNITVTQPERDFNRRVYEEALEITELGKWLEENKIHDHQILGKMLGNGIDVGTGYWQRIAIARAIYRDSQILVLDESLTQVDGFSRRPIVERIIKHRPKQTFIYITQDETEKDLFDKIFYIENGKLTKEETK